MNWKTTVAEKKTAGSLDLQLKERAFKEITGALGIPLFDFNGAWLYRIRSTALSLACRRMLASLWDEPEGIRDGVSEVHVKRAFINTYCAVLELWLPRGSSASPEECRQEAVGYADRCFTLYEARGFLYRQPYLAFPAPFRCTVLPGEDLILARGIGPGVACTMSAGAPCVNRQEAGNILLPAGEAESIMIAPETFLCVPPEPPSEAWRRVVKNAVWHAYDDEDPPLEYLHESDFSLGYWDNTHNFRKRSSGPEGSALSLARLKSGPTQAYFLFRQQGATMEIAPLSQADAQRSTSFAAQILRERGKLPPVKVRRMKSTSGNCPYAFVRVNFGYLPPPEITSFSELAGWPADFSRPTPFQRIMAEPLFTMLIPLLTAEGFTLKFEN
ncbi:hypothetical protein [uncultured Sutterella sp.]|uniref:hypothetical protein n=1 Tax=uncultured Sutterella sp. TaxID=286133 RepID=UPI002611DB3D|nr:hypothetical protein [uncultured Sutterella sp.]